MKTELQITPEGRPASGDPRETIIPDNDEERLMLARRLVADRCLYGVDKNHLAVEMGKLSLWLITLDKNRPFTFLDHALRHGDSLIGADEEMFLRWAHGLQSSSMPLFDQEIRKLMDEARTKRRALQAFDVREVRDAEEKARLLAEADAAMARIKLGCDLLVGARLLDDLNQSEQDALLANGLLDYIAGRDWQDPIASRAVKAAQALPAFHWQFEFPEVFAQGGFSAFMGNPPFIGGKRIRESLGDDYRAVLYKLYEGSKGGADLSAFFFLQAFTNIVEKGCIGLIATNTIAQGDTLRTGLDPIHNRGGTIYRAFNDYAWPGQAAVVIDVIHLRKGDFKGQKFLDDNPVKNITPLLDDMTIYGKPFRLLANLGKSYIGSYTRGLGFVLAPDEAQTLIDTDQRNKDVTHPYLNGQDLNSSPTQKPGRWVIDFKNWPLQKAETYIEPMRILRERVYPDRMGTAKNRKVYEKLWWQFWRPRIELYETTAPLQRVLVVARVTKFVNFIFVPNNLVFNEKLVVFTIEGANEFALLQSSIHDVWAWQRSSTLGSSTLNYAPSDCFDTFPFPQTTGVLTAIGEQYHSYRQQVMQKNNTGLTKTYNRFHDPAKTARDIVNLRQLHMEMDNAVAIAYGWQDLDLGHGFHETAQGLRYTISEPARREVLTRLLQLNHQRYEEEVKLGLHDKKGKKQKAKSTKKKAPKKNDGGQLKLFE